MIRQGKSPTTSILKQSQMHSVVNEPSPPVESMFLQLVQCNQKKVPQKPPWVI